MEHKYLKIYNCTRGRELDSLHEPGRIHWTALTKKAGNPRAGFAIRPQQLIQTHDTAVTVLNSFVSNAGSLEDIQRVVISAKDLALQSYADPV